MVTPRAGALRLGVWTPLPHTIAPEPRMQDAITRLSTPGGVGLEDPSFSFACEVVACAEEAGFDITLIAERFLGPDLEAFTLGAALAARTRTIQLLVAVHPGIIPPQVAAKMIASLDRISGGRAALNLVNGWWAEEFKLYSNGGALDGNGERYLRMSEYVDVLKGMLAGGPVSYEGRFYQAQEGRLPTRPARDHIPLYAASRAAEGKEVVARTCDLWFADYRPDHMAYEENLARMRSDITALQAMAGGQGRKVEAGVSCHVICAPTQAEAEARAATLLAYGQRDRIAAVAAKGLGAGLVGTPALIAQRILAYHAIGVSCLMLHFHPMLEGLQTFIGEVSPRLDTLPLSRAPQAPLEVTL